MSFEEQIMPKDKYPSMFLHHMETIVFISLGIFFVTCTVLKIRELPILSGEMFSHVTPWANRMGAKTFDGLYTECVGN